MSWPGGGRSPTPRTWCTPRPWPRPSGLPADGRADPPRGARGAGPTRGPIAPPLASGWGGGVCSTWACTPWRWRCSWPRRPGWRAPRAICRRARAWRSTTRRRCGWRSTPGCGRRCVHVAGRRAGLGRPGGQRHQRRAPGAGARPVGRAERRAPAAAAPAGGLAADQLHLLGYIAQLAALAADAARRRAPAPARLRPAGARHRVRRLRSARTGEPEAVPFAGPRR